LVLFVRHGLTASTGAVLSGWTAGIPLDERGREQAAALATRLAPVHLDAIITSPLQRCRETSEAVAAAGDRTVAVQEDERLGECRYGDWTGKPLKRLARERLWHAVQLHPGAVRFPGADGESIFDMQYRAVTAVRDWNGRLGPDAVYLICSHADVIKAVIADGLGLHIDMLQRVQVDPCSLSVIRYTPLRPFLVRMNDTGGVDGLKKPKDRPGNARVASADGRVSRRESDAPVGGGAGG
jgi:probable phosphomutase (TIGR03848 family)